MQRCTLDHAERGIRMGRPEIDRRQDDLLLQGIHDPEHLDGGAGSDHVADLSLHRVGGNLLEALAENAVQAVVLGRGAFDGARAVEVDAVDLVRRNAGLVERGAHRLGRGGTGRFRVRNGPCVHRAAVAGDLREDFLPVGHAFGILHQEGHGGFAEDGPVAVQVAGAAFDGGGFVTGRQGAERGESEVGERHDHGVGAAAHDGPGQSAAKQPPRQADGLCRGRAGGCEKVAAGSDMPFGGKRTHVGGQLVIGAAAQNPVREGFAGSDEMFDV